MFEVKEMAGVGGKAVSYSETRKALRMAGFELPELRDARGRINIGNRKSEVWVRDLVDADSPESSETSPIQSMSQRAIAQLLWTELRGRDIFRAEKIEAQLAAVAPRLVE